ncbi:hypothetical protein Pmar_PMAR018408 [Perkinsus marinus ATCC 50983]|uniref:Uncharacterized protein n=1 Tax=Perkinsus marinus (strain ATCC 50983 / TXsc) TaxID=423536 RepID=C5LJF2_PERM5|nr:hypothetical protein Pmar_PMAR018408 [Perkinsus marinus ATCC 50983]EER03152.1 hypothetical protein Pmar_PMAR018408 [Perkinsus marinus ATCC 50983]|eukprot:XP_002771336.1 hypothetical protein Pmar_PMAR018408 [Perkinsus marinus ATCC 50983]
MVADQDGVNSEEIIADFKRVAASVDGDADFARVRFIQASEGVTIPGAKCGRFATLAGIVTRWTCKKAFRFVEDNYL